MCLLENLFFDWDMMMTIDMSFDLVKLIVAA